jgi:hypothetical protein
MLEIPSIASDDIADQGLSNISTGYTSYSFHGGKIQSNLLRLRWFKHGSVSETE